MVVEADDHEVAVGIQSCGEGQWPGSPGSPVIELAVDAEAEVETAIGAVAGGAQPRSPWEPTTRIVPSAWTRTAARCRPRGQITAAPWPGAPAQGPRP